MENQKEYRKKIIKKLRKLEKNPLIGKQRADGKPIGYFSSEVIAKGVYEGHEIITGGFKDFGIDTGIIKLKVSEVLFVFAMPYIQAYSFTNPLDSVLEKVKEEINRGLIKSPYFFELNNGNIDEVKNPKWWKGTKQHSLK